ncbi:MAG: alpha/beta hydrolase [Acidobacteria bacterium]|nr:alpha/beta hydrolase [Acidobacteriota bacterium]
MHRAWLMLFVAAVGLAEDGQRLLRLDHYVPVRSIAPSINGQLAQIYVREVAQAGLALRSGAVRPPVVLFIHGAGTPAEVAFDVPYRDCSWMAYLAKAGYDVFAMDMTGYGRSTRPAPMNDPCNPAQEQQRQFVAAPCASTIERIATIESDWHDIGAVVDRIRAMRGVDKLNLVGWSLGGPRAGGYAAQHPDKVARIALLAPAYSGGRSAPPAGPPNTAPVNTQSRADLDANWDRQTGLPGSIRHGGARRRVGRHAGVRPGGRYVGRRRAPRAERRWQCTGVEPGGGGKDAHARAIHRRRARQAGAAGARPRAARKRRRFGEGSA